MERKFLDQIFIQIRHFREEAGLTQIDMAEKLKIGVRSYQRYETCTSVPSLMTLFDISQILNFNMKDLFSPFEKLSKIGDVTFYSAEQEKEFKKAAGPVDILFNIKDSPTFKKALLEKRLEFMENEPLFNGSQEPLAISTPKVTLLNSAAQGRFFSPTKFVNTSSFHSSPRNVGILWAALLHENPSYFIMHTQVPLPSGVTHLSSNCLFIKLNRNYFILRSIKMDR